MNHYFEIMNSRGEQLEKHEVLKAKLMSYFVQTEQRELYEYCFNLIWETCSNMERYVQHGFTPAQRHLIFGHEDWNELVISSFDDFASKIVLCGEHAQNIPLYQQRETQLSLDEIISLPSIEEQKNKDQNQPDRFNSVVNFPNFLIHVLRIQVNEDVALDDKKLLTLFDYYIPKEEIAKEQFAKTYIFNLLKCKFLFDKYIIKREFTANTDRWVLKSLRWYNSASVKNGVKYVNSFGEEQNESFDNDNRRILMLLSMFHVSIPSMSYKYWLYAALRYVYHQNEVESAKYILYLEHIAKSFVYDNYLGNVEQNYHQMTTRNLQEIERLPEDINLEKLQYGNLRNNLVFNFIDYLLWLNQRGSDSKIKQYEYTFRSSVEHYYPQHPINKAIPEIEKGYLHSIGNLCLISHEKNSRLNNHTPKAKQEYYAQSDSIDSIKQYVMMQEKDWDTSKITAHEEQIIKLLTDNLSSAFNWEAGEITKARKWYKLYKQQDKVLLIRALMCFGRIDFHTGWTCGMEKWNVYQWDKIEESEVYSKYIEFISENNPNSLEEVIEYNLKNNTELKEDSYRYAFVARPEIVKYCKEGNFGWADNGKRVVLLENNRASIYQSCDLYCFCANRFLKSKYKINSYCGNDRLKISIIEEEEKLRITSLDWNAIALLEIWNDIKGHLCYELNTRNLHGNSKIIKNLKENGWEYNGNNKLFYSSKPYLLKLSEDVENNIVKTEQAIEYILKRII